MKLNLLPVLLLSSIVTIGCNANKEAVLEITVDYQQKVKWASDQYAVWIEDTEGHYINTVFVTKYATTEQAYTERPDCVPTWVRKAHPAAMAPEQLDAVSGATPASGVHTYRWNLTDRDGKKVPRGVYVFRLEATLDGSSRVIFKNEINLGKRPMTIEAIPEYTEPDQEKHKDMIQSVVAAYKFVKKEAQ